MIAQYALKEIRRRKLRSLANVLGYVIAVAFLVSVVTLSLSYNTVAAGDLRGIGTHFAVYIPASKNCPCQFGEVGPFFKDVYTPTFNSSVVDTIKDLEGVADASPCLMFRFENLTIMGVDFDSWATETTVVAPDEVVRGNFGNMKDLNGVLIDLVFAKVSNLDVGDELNAFDRTLTVAGVVDPALHSKPAGIANIYAPLSVVQDIARYYGDLYGFSVRDINLVAVEISLTGNDEYISTVEQSVLGTLESFAGQTGAVVGYQCGYAARKVVNITEDSAWIISIVILISVTLFSIKSQFGSVVERTRDIGILKALGWTDADITKQVCLESLLQGIIGGTIGALLGYLATILISQLGLVPTQNLVLVVSPWLVILGLGISIGGGILAGIVPAWHAARLQPAEALRRF
jgi:putative ABC transport system permease protein